MNQDAASPPLTPPAIPDEKHHLMATLIVAGFLTWLGDFLFWKHAPGVSLAVYVCGVAGAVLAMRWKKMKNKMALVAAGLVAVASCATALEISFTNVAVLFMLLAVVCGECWYGELKSG